MKNFSLLIVEDDPLIAFDLQSLAKEAGYEVVHTFHTAEDALIADVSNVDLALLDINLNHARIDGVEVGIAFKQKNVPCIFISSYYDKTTVERVKKVNPLAYIIKPFEDHDVLLNLELACNKLNKKEKKPERTAVKEGVFVKSNGKLTKVKFEDTLFLQANDMYAFIYTKDQKVLASQTLKSLIEVYPTNTFLRIHRSYVVNLNHIDGICDNEVLLGEHKLPIGRSHKQELFDKITMV